MAAHEDFPLPTVCPDVYHCGYHSEARSGSPATCSACLSIVSSRRKTNSKPDSKLISQLWRDVLVRSARGRQHHDGLAALPPGPGKET